MYSNNMIIVGFCLWLWLLHRTLNIVNHTDTFALIAVHVFQMLMMGSCLHVQDSNTILKNHVSHGENMQIRGKM